MKLLILFWILGLVVSISAALAVYLLHRDEIDV